MHSFLSAVSFCKSAITLGFAGALALYSTASSAQAYPEKPIRLIVPSPPGGGTDALSRLVSQKLIDLLQWQFVVDNRAGAGGNLGMDLAAKSAPDGYTIVMGESSNLAINPYLYKKIPFDAVKDIAPVALVGTVPLVIVVPLSRPFESVAALVAAAKSKPLVFASSGNGTVGHLAGETWRRTIGIEWTHVPYKGAGPVMVDLLGGRVDLHFGSLPAALPMVNGGKLRALAVTAAQRVPSLPDIPTLIESGFPNSSYNVFYGVVVPAGTPKTIVARLNAEIVRAIKTPDIQANLAGRGVTASPGTAEQFSQFLTEERNKWSRAVKASGATVD